MSKVNIIAKGVKGKEYIITDMIATRISEKKFKELQKINTEKLGDYRFIENKHTDFSWWARISKKLTPTKISSAYFECDFYGNIREY